MVDSINPKAFEFLFDKSPFSIKEVQIKNTQSNRYSKPKIVYFSFLEGIAEVGLFGNLSWINYYAE